MTKAKIGIVTVSDRASAGIYEDLSGKAIIAVLNEYLTSEWEAVYEVIPDEQDVIEATLIKMADEQNCSLIVTTGGTGPPPTPTGWTWRPASGSIVLREKIISKLERTKINKGIESRGTENRARQRCENRSRGCLMNISKFKNKKSMSGSAWRTQSARGSAGAGAAGAARTEIADFFSTHRGAPGKCSSFRSCARL